MIQKITNFKHFPMIMLVVLLYTTSKAQPFAPPLPEPGTATIDGNPSEWNLTDDFFTDMWEAGNSTHPVYSKCYLRYDCDNEILYLLVLAEKDRGNNLPDVKIAADEAGKQWVKVHDIGNSPIVDGNSGNDGTAPDFSFINSDGTRADGWEASMPLAPPASSPFTYQNFHVHAQVDASLSSTSTSANNGGNSGTPLQLDCSVLPVELTSFSVTISNSLAQLNWETATEVNNYGFEIQRSSEIEDWNKIGFVNGHGNSNSPKLYTFTDNSVTLSGAYFYRLKQIDIDGTSDYSDVVNINLTIEEMKYQLNQNFPNPFNPSTTISYTIPEQAHVDLIVYNIFGEEITRLVSETKDIGTYSINFNAENLAAGLYFYTIQTESYSATKKLILLK